jgi:hypothetical protein
MAGKDHMTAEQYYAHRREEYRRWQDESAFVAFVDSRRAPTASHQGQRAELPPNAQAEQPASAED